VAIGAAIQGGVLTGEVKDIVLLDVTPLTLGIETLGGVTTKMIPANSTIPIKKTEIFTTAVDNQSSVEIHVLQGERTMAIDNRSLGKFHLEGLPPAMRGIPKVEVTFDIDASGILHISAKDTASGKEQTIRITQSSGLSDAEIEKMKKDAKEHEAEDKKRKELVDLKNQAEALIFNTEKQTKDFGAKINSEMSSKINNAIERLKSVKDSDNSEEIKSAIDGVNAAWNEIAEVLYSNTENTSETDSNESNSDSSVNEENKN
jgi:molecular chaperone DnaK